MYGRNACNQMELVISPLSSTALLICVLRHVLLVHVDLKYVINI